MPDAGSEAQGSNRPGRSSARRGQPADPGADVPSAQRAARLAGATAALLETIQAPLDRQFRAPYERAIASARAILGDEAFAVAWDAGKQMTLDEAVAFALAPEATAS